MQKYLGKGCQHVASTNFSLLGSVELEELLELEPNYRQEYCPDFFNKDGWAANISEVLSLFVNHLVRKYGFDAATVSREVEAEAIKIQGEIDIIKAEGTPVARCIRDMNNYSMIDSSNPTSHLIVVPMDKFADRFVLLCKHFNGHNIHRILWDSGAYVQEHEDQKNIVDRINQDMVDRFDVVRHGYFDKEENVPKSLSYLYPMGKLHKDKFAAEW